ncbi:metallophosphoesterase 1-like protein [Trichonephila inaurata madagascariensis]|uniref:Metallophosphoesterase 1-like protein n=1 Tax=Trichonephila inaurata madagascariensis TaxID=2747483 RepID=A0A8X6XZ29_9ARAC|nr:metallophosphoesterase 1-like protein [Trichonephila inaurata madagascariensis]
MNILCKKFRHTLKCPLLLVLSSIILFEWLEYSFTPLLYWSKISADYSSQDDVKLLIVGDPQLLGYHYSPPGLLGMICCWDADRYVRKTFVKAYNYVNPDIVIFLGDNLDEGEIASDDDFLSYFHRFRHVFKEVDFNRALIVPGDNDIGGEGSIPQPFFEKRFNKYFRDDVFTRYQFLEFVKVNYITHSNRYHFAPNVSESNFRIILSHIPLTPSYSSFVSRVVPYVKPHIILSAHDHKSQHIVAERKTGVIIRTSHMTDVTSCSFNISDFNIHEITVPTCSYRMGTLKMGYGALKISKSGEVSYNVLWLPSRFRQLIIHLFVLIIVSVYLLIHFSKCCMRQSNGGSYFQLYNQNRYFNPSNV